MKKSDVYFTDFSTTFSENQLQKLKRLIIKAGIEKIDFKNKFVAIKMHFGEMGNLAYLRPQYVKVLANLIKEKGGRPFIVDCNTLYVGMRANAIDHMQCAMENGFNFDTTGCHTFIGDGLKGLNEHIVPIDGDYVKEAKIGALIMEADIIISLTHFKGHEQAGFGGTIKNIGMGSGSRGGKMEQHAAGKPNVNQDMCVACRLCSKACAHSAITYENEGIAYIDHDKCVGCGRCLAMCSTHAIEAGSDESNDILNCKMAEYTLAVLKGRPHFHVSLIRDVSPYCDCHSENDIPIIPDVGMLASFDPVAIDKACADLANKMPIIEKSRLSKMKHETHDHFINSHPDTDWRECLKHGEKIGLGTQNYNLIEI